MIELILAILAIITVIYLLYLLFIYVIIPVVVFLGTVLVAAIACAIVLGVATGFLASLFFVIKVCKDKLFIRNKNVTNNAYESYFYSKGDWGENLKTVCKETFSQTYAKASDYGSQAFDSSEEWYNRIRYFFAMLACMLGCFVFVPILLLVFSLLFIIIWSLNNIWAFLFWGLERVWLYIRSIYAICPTCNKHVSHPIYECPHCKSKHNNLVPSSRYGIFSRTCSCGTKLPTLLLFGKGRLQGECPHCHGNKGVSLDYTPYTIAFIGGKSVGKTFLRNVMCASLFPYAKSKNWKTIIPPEEQNVVSAIRRELQSGQLPNETFLSAKAVAVRIGIQRMTFSNHEERLYLYDAPGEAFEQEKHMDTYNYYQYLKTVIIVIDPLSLRNIRFRINNKSIGHISQASPVNCLQRWLNSMERIHTEGNLKSFLKKVQCCVVITKTDVPELQQVVKLSANSTSLQCKYFLENYGLPEIIPLLEDYFGEVGYFAVSCSGGKSDGTAFSPTGINNIWAWILN